MNSLHVEHSNNDELEDSLIQEAIEIISATTPYDLASRGDQSPYPNFKNPALLSFQNSVSPMKIVKRLSAYLSP